MQDSARLSIETHQASQECTPGAECDCNPAGGSRAHLSWPKTLAITAAGGLLCLLIVKLLGA